MAVFYIYIAPRLFKKIYKYIEDTKVEKRNLSVTARINEISIQQQITGYLTKIENLTNALTLKDNTLKNQEVLLNQLQEELKENHLRSSKNEESYRTQINSQSQEIQRLHDSLSESLKENSNLSASLSASQEKYSNLTADLKSKTPQVRDYSMLGISQNYLYPIEQFAKTQEVSSQDALIKYFENASDIFQKLKANRPKSEILTNAIGKFTSIQNSSYVPYLNESIQLLHLFLRDAKPSQNDEILVNFLLEIMNRIFEFHK